jgi:hypothetical protein
MKAKSHDFPVEKAHLRMADVGSVGKFSAGVVFLRMMKDDTVKPRPSSSKRKRLSFQYITSWAKSVPRFQFPFPLSRQDTPVKSVINEKREVPHGGHGLCDKSIQLITLK